MLQSFIKEWLLQKKKKVYSIIADTYREELAKLKPTLFRAWLAKELDIPESAINIHSLYSALKRLRKKETMPEKTNNSNDHRQNTAAIERIEDSHPGSKAFNFSVPSSKDKNAKRITEY